MSNILDVFHKSFKYVIIEPVNSIEIYENEFIGTEKEFQSLLKKLLCEEELNENSKTLYSEFLKKEIKNNIKDTNVDETKLEGVWSKMCNEKSYQIIPLILPTKSNNYFCLNMYIDNLGSYKQYEYNERASKICSSQIKGRAILSASYDDENNFKRLNYSINETYKLLEKPIKFNSNAITNSGLKLIKSDYIDTKSKCNSCYKKVPDVEKLFLCSQCKLYAYCSRECQKNDWPFHKKICNN